MPTVNVTHDLVVNGLGLMLVPGTVVNMARATPFTQRISTGKPTHSDLDNWDVISSQDWTHGLGQEGGGDPSALDLAAYYFADGIETSIPGSIQLATECVSSDAGFVARTFCDGGNTYVFAGGNTSTRYYDPVGNTWANAETGLAAASVAMVEYKAVLYNFLTGNNVARMCANPASAPTTWAAITGSVARSVACVWKDKLWAAGNNATDINSIYSFDGTTWSSAVAIGDSGVGITSLTACGTYLAIGKKDRLFLYDGTNVIETGLVVSPYVDNFRGATYFNGQYWYPRLNKVEKTDSLSSISITDRTPAKWGSEAAINYGYGFPIGFTANCNRVFALFHQAENSYPVVLKHNQLGWHPVYVGTAGATAYAIYYSEVADRLFFNDGATRFQRYLTNGNPYPSYPTSGTQYIEFSIDSVGFDEIDKAYRSLSLIAENLTANVKITAYYQDNKDGVWTAFPSSFTTSPQQEINFSTSVTAIGARLMQVRLVLTTNSATATPRVKVATMKRILRPKTYFVVSASVQIADYVRLLDGTKDTNTASDLLSSLLSTSDTVEPVTLDSPLGRRHKGVLSNISFHEALKRDNG